MYFSDHRDVKIETVNGQDNNNRENIPGQGHKPAVILSYILLN